MKKLVAIVLCVCMVATMSVTALATEFSDIDNHWAEDHIVRWEGYEIVNGVGGDMFDPEGTMTRAQAAAVFARLLKLDVMGDITGFTDVDADEWYAEYIAKCVAAGIMDGIGGGKMDPDGVLTREQMMVMLCRAVGIKPETTCNKQFVDSDKISDWAEGYINALVNANIVDGVGGNTMAPTTDINRASMMALLDKSIVVYADEADATVTVGEGTGIVLVVADNVTIKDAPAGTIVVTTENTAGTTVNGTEIEEGTVHEVESTQPSIPGGIVTPPAPPAPPAGGDTGDTSGSGTGETSGSGTGETSGSGTGETSGSGTGETSGSGTGETSGSGTGETSTGGIENI